MEQSRADPSSSCFQVRKVPILDINCLSDWPETQEFWLYLMMFSQATIRYILWRNHTTCGLLASILAVTIFKMLCIKKIFPGMETVSPQLRPFLHCGFMWFDFIFKMSVYIMHEIIPCASGICVIWGWLTAFVGVIGEVICCRERIRDHFENWLALLLVCAADLERCCQVFIVL